GRLRVALAAGVPQLHLTSTALFPDVKSGDLRFRQWQGRLAADRGDVELARQQHHEAAAMANAAGDATGLLAGAPVKIGTRRSDDRRSGILCDHQTTEGRGSLALDRELGFDEKWRAVLMHAVDRDGAARRQRHPLRAEWLPFVGQPGDAEE